MTLLTSVFDVFAMVCAAVGIVLLSTRSMKIDPASRSILGWILAAITLSAFLSILRRHDLVPGPVDLDLVLDLLEFIVPVFFLLFVHSYAQGKLNHTILKQNRDYQALLDNIPGIAYRSSGDKQARIEQISNNVASLLGISAEEFLSRPNPSLVDFMHPEDRDSILPTYLDNIRSLRPFTLEYRLLDKDGNIVWVVDRGQPISRSDEKGYYVDGILLDSTRMVTAEQALSEREERMQAQQRALLALSEFSGSLEQAMQLLTELMAETLGCSRASVWLYSQDRTRAECLDLYSLEEEQHLPANGVSVSDFPGYFSFMELGEVIATSNVSTDERTSDLARVVLEDLDIVANMDTPIKIDGEIRGILSASQQHRGREWTIDEQNFSRSLANMVSLMLEISVNREMEKAMRDERDRAQSYLDTVNVIIVSVDTDGIVTLINKRGCELLGYSHDEIVGKHWVNTFIPEEQRDLILNNFIEIEHNEDNFVRDFENQILTRDGRKLLIHWNNAYQTDDDGKVVGYLSAGEDITEAARQREEKARMQEEMEHIQKMHSIVQLTGGIAHDFNNMLTSIMGYADLAQIAMKRNAEIESDRYLGAIRATSKKAGKLVSQLLDYSRENVLIKEPVNLNTMITDSRRMLEAMISSSIQLVDELDASIPEISGNISQIQQVVINLCQNAKEALKYQDATIWIKTGMKTLHDASCDSCFQKVNGQFVSLEITDNGTGIDPSIRDSMFDPFTSSKELGEGTGLGLSAVHGIVHMHGGHIVVDSEPGQMTRFSVLFPVTAESNIESVSALSQADVSAKRDSGQTGRPRVLLVDDDESVTRLLSSYLDRNGIDSRVINNAENAWSVFAEDCGAFDIVITDQTMPNLTGLELARKIRSVRTDIPVVLCSGNNDMVNEEEAAAMGVSRFLNKPVRLESLTTVISELTRN